MRRDPLHTECCIYYHKYIMQITQFSQYRCTQLQYRFAVISEAHSTYQSWGTVWLGKFLEEKILISLFTSRSPIWQTQTNGIFVRFRRSFKEVRFRIQTLKTCSSSTDGREESGALIFLRLDPNLGFLCKDPVSFKVGYESGFCVGSESSQSQLGSATLIIIFAHQSPSSEPGASSYVFVLRKFID